jgi:poly(hydroxyalkanoate) depolymerase family esterase
VRRSWQVRYLIAMLTVSVACASTGKPTSNRMTPTTERGTYRWQGATRDFVVHQPASATSPRAGDDALVVVLHGCTQDAADAARGTRLDGWADREGFTVLYPEQPASANAKKCWNWYLPAETGRGAGEAGLLAAMIDSVARAQRVSSERIAIVGMSAGAAMAASLVVAYPQRYGALVMHSAVPANAARDVMSAVAVMQKSVPDAEQLGQATLRAMGAEARPIPVLVVHGGSDAVVSPLNLDVIARQWTLVNAGAAKANIPLSALVTAPRVAATRGHAVHGTRTRDAQGRVSVETWLVDGLGHAWSGGSAGGTFTAPAAPDATAMLVSFLHEVWGGR